ncbi:hypothetical protein C8R47DRAFT_1320915 [Mycena vitilis]|nr:hypothetical protein C8R47DRAFT_1320915 [Mycena vitilis]
MNHSTSRATKLGLCDLVEDVLLLILAECDILDVLAIGAVSKCLRRLACSHDMWALLVTNLTKRGFIDRQRDDFEDLNTDQLVSLVKRPLRGPRTWAAASTKSLVQRSVNTLGKLVRKLSANPPSAGESRRIVLHPEITTGPGMQFKQNIAKLLPGGEFVLFLNSARLECWSVFEDRLVWKHAPTMDQVNVRDFDAELAGHQLVILTCQRERGGHVAGKTFLEVCTLDTNSGLSCLELVTRVADAANAAVDSPHWGCSVCGDIVAAYLYREHRVVLVNWRTRSQIVLETNTTHLHEFESQFVLVPDFLVSAQRDSNGKQRLAVTPWASLGFWEPTSILKEPAAHIKAADIPVRTDDAIALQGHLSLSWRRSLWVHHNPLRRGRYKVWLHTVVDRNDRLCSYDLERRDGGMSWRLVSSTPMSGRIGPSGLALSGHAIGWHIGESGQMVFAPAHRDTDSGLRDILKIDGRSNLVHLSSYSGALTYSTRQEIVIVHIASEADLVEKFIDQWLARAGACPLSLFFGTSEFSLGDAGDAIYNAIRRYSDRVEYLDIDIMQGIGELGLDSAAFPLLQRAALSYATPDWPDVVFNDAPRFHDLCCASGINTITFPWLQLTKFTGTLCNLDIFTFATNLIEVECRFDHDEESLLPVTAVTHPRISTFTVEDRSCGLIRYLSLPALRYLDVSEMDPEDYASLEPFLERSSSPLESLSVRADNGCYAGWYSCFPRLADTLKNLNISGVPRDVMYSMFPIGHEKSLNIYCLRSLRAPSFEDVEGGVDLHHLIEFLYSRFDELRSFRLVWRYKPFLDSEYIADPHNAPITDTISRQTQSVDISPG